MTRSALKPFQAMPFVAGGGVERFGYSTGSGRAALREPLRRAAPRRRRRRHARRAPAIRAERSAHAAAHAPGYFEVRGESRRRRPRTRRSRTTARASTAACSRIASSADCRRRPHLADRASAAAGDPARGRALHGDAGGGARRGHRRLLGAELRGAARRGSRMRFARLAVDAARRRLRRPRPRRAGGRDDRASGDGLRRGSQRPRADAAPGAAIGSPRSAPKACRRSALRSGGHRHRGSRSPTANRRVLRPDSSRAVLDQLGLLDDAQRHGARRLARAGRAQLPRNRSPGRSDRPLSWTKLERRSRAVDEQAPLARGAELTRAGGRSLRASVRRERFPGSYLRRDGSGLRGQ